MYTFLKIYSPFLYPKKEKAPAAIKITQRGGGGNVRPNRPLRARVAIPQQIKTECPNKRSRLDAWSGILLVIKKSSPSPMFIPATPWTAGWMLATTCPDGSSNIGFENSEVITEALGRMFINANVRAPISKWSTPTILMISLVSIIPLKTSQSIFLKKLKIRENS